MMTPLENTQRSQGGKNRANNQSAEDRSFLATLAASRRPLMHDVKMTPEEVLKTFKAFADERRWLCVFIVCADSSVIPHTFSADKQLRRLAEAGGPIGFLGVAFLGKSVQVLIKPLKRGTRVIEDLDRIGRLITAVVLERLGHTKLPEIEL